MPHLPPSYKEVAPSRALLIGENIGLRDLTPVIVFASKAAKDCQMKSTKLIGSLVILFAFVGCTAAPDRILLKEQGDNNRCHMKIETYGDPAMPTEREVVDYYGPCDQRPSKK